MNPIHLLPPDDFPLDAASPFADAHHLLSHYFHETRYAELSYCVKLEDHETGLLILKSGQKLQKQLVHAALERMEHLGEDCRVFKWSFHTLFRFLFTTQLPFREEEISSLLDQILSLLRRKSLVNNQLLFVLDGLNLTGSIEHYASRQTLSSEIYLRLHRLRTSEELPLLVAEADYAAYYWWIDSAYQVMARLDRLLGREHPAEIEGGTPWAEAIIDDYTAMTTSRRLLWNALLSHMRLATASKPSQKWRNQVSVLIAAIGEDEYQERFSRWSGLVTSSALVASSDSNMNMLRGLVWAFPDLRDLTGVSRTVANFAEICFTSLPGIGVRLPKVGNACIWTLGTVASVESIGQLACLRTKLRDRGALKLIAASIETAAAKAGMTVDELEDLAVPTGGLDADGARREIFGDLGVATLTLDSKTAKTNLQWFGSDGKPRKSVPAAVKKDFAAEVKALKAAEDEIKQTLGAQSARLDRALLDERAWTGIEWRERYLAHPILSNLARRLIWTFDGQPGLPGGNEIIGADGQTLSLPSDTVTVRLWHPIGCDLAEVLRWRDTLEAQRIMQPFKQAHREVYLLTDAERNTGTYSNRFAAHILKQHQFNSLAVLRGWKNQLRLMVDDSYPPATKTLPRHNLRAEFWVEGIGEDYGTDTNETGTFLRLVTDQVRFYPLDAPTNDAHACGEGYTTSRANAPADALPIDQIPPLVFSEVLRDVDLFVGVASLGNDPNWADGGPQGRYRDYWQEYSFGDLTESATTRADVLARLLPRLKIADRCRLDGKFLRVRGDRRTYKIHLGSGNILMEPNDQYLCIVPKSGVDETSGSGLFLPFEGDRTLSVIVSKAFLLAADTRITDPTIIRQIEVK